MTSNKKRIIYSLEFSLKLAEKVGVVEAARQLMWTPRW